jgi:catechol 2,3-dioxygenase-like lactoylglutathione lyase family enzyme
MFTHIMVGANDLSKSRPFYEAALGALGHKNMMPVDAPRCVFRTEQGAFLVGVPANGEPACYANGGTIGFKAESQAAIDAFHSAGIAAGGVDEGAPGIRTGAGHPLYGAYLRDPDGNKICAFAQPES